MNKKDIRKSASGGTPGTPHMHGLDSLSPLLAARPSEGKLGYRLGVMRAPETRTESLHTSCACAD